MKTLLISGNTLQEWDIEEALTNKVKSKDQIICDMIQSDWDNTVGPYCEGLTYLQLEQINTYQ
jgi:hypothetical protein